MTDRGYRRTGPKLLIATTGLWLFVATPPSAWPQPASPSVPATRPATTVINLTDLAGHAAAQPAITSIVAQGIMRPVANAQFAPDAPTTLGDFAMAMQRMFNLSQPSQPVTFTDVPRNSPYYAAVEALAPYLHRQFLCFGCALGKNLFLGQALTRAQLGISLVSILVAQNKLQLLPQDQAQQVLSGVVDADTLPAPARPFFATAIKSGITPLLSGNRFSPGLERSRADVAVTLDSVQKKFKLPQLPHTR